MGDRLGQVNHLGIWPAVADAGFAKGGEGDHCDRVQGFPGGGEGSGGSDESSMSMMNVCLYVLFV